MDTCFAWLVFASSTRGLRGIISIVLHHMLYHNFNSHSMGLVLIWASCILHCLGQRCDGCGSLLLIREDLRRGAWSLKYEANLRIGFKERPPNRYPAYDACYWLELIRLGPKFVREFIESFLRYKFYFVMHKIYCIELQTSQKNYISNPKCGGMLAGPTHRRLGLMMVLPCYREREFCRRKTTRIGLCWSSHW
jgi:hypothetical protein